MMIYALQADIQSFYSGHIIKSVNNLILSEKDSCGWIIHFQFWCSQIAYFVRQPYEYSVQIIYNKTPNFTNFECQSTTYRKTTLWSYLSSRPARPSCAPAQKLLSLTIWRTSIFKQRCFIPLKSLTDVKIQEIANFTLLASKKGKKSAANSNTHKKMHIVKQIPKKHQYSDKNCPKNIYYALSFCATDFGDPKAIRSVTQRRENWHR